MLRGVLEAQARFRRMETTHCVETRHHAKGHPYRMSIERELRRPDHSVVQPMSVQHGRHCLVALPACCKASFAVIIHAYVKRAYATISCKDSPSQNASEDVCWTKESEVEKLDPGLAELNPLGMSG